jgi:putative chitinase
MGVTLQGLLLCGLMGLIGQGVRAVIGLKNAAADFQAAPSQSNAFSASYLLVSLMIGFIAGVVAGLAMYNQIFAVDCAKTCDPMDLKTLLGLAGAGYVGADFIENAARTLIPGVGGPTTSTPPPADGDKDAKPSPSVPPLQPLDQAKVADLDVRVGVLEANAQPPTSPSAGIGGAAGKVTVAMVCKMFPATKPASITQNLPFVLDGLQAVDLTDKAMVCMALGTIRAETEGFVPISEFKSVFNTATTPFDKYEPGTALGHRLGNTQTGDGAKFKGRGFVQLTGRSNYTKTGEEIHVDLVNSPELANNPTIAGRILAQFLLDHQQRIRDALQKNDLATAREAVNGGTHGLDKFTDAYRTGMNVIPA